MAETSDLVTPIPPVASLPEPGPTPPAVPPVAPKQSRLVRFLTAPFLLAWRRPRRAAALLLLILVSLATLGGIGLLVWTNYHENAARREIERGHNWAAIRHLQHSRTIRPNRPDVLLLCARVAWRSGVFIESDEILDMYWKQRGDDEALVTERLLVRAARGDLASVWGILQNRINENHPSAPVAREALVTGLLQRFDLPKATKLVDEWLKQEPDSTLALFAQGKLQEARTDNSGALTAFRRLLELDPEHDEARYRLTRLLLSVRQGEEALRNAEYLTQRLPENQDVLVQVAQALDLQGRRDEAGPYLDRCLALNPQHSGALLERGKMAMGAGDSVQAEELFGRAVRSDPSDLIARFQYYLALTRNQKKAEAAKELETIDRLQTDTQRINDIAQGKHHRSPDDPTLCYDIAMICDRIGRPQETLRWLLKGLQSDPDHLPTHRALATLYRAIGNPILAARHRAIAQRLSGQPQR